MSGQRSSARDLVRAREGRSTRFFLTGGTGFLGSHLAVGLLKRGFSVRLLARPGVRGTAADRVAGLLDWFGLPVPERRRLRVVEGDITRPRMGLGPDDLREALAETDEVIHCASNTSFSERKRAEVEAVNAVGLSRLLDFARESGARHFHHVSTAFVAGRTAGPCAEGMTTPPGFWNVYEESKWRGERLAYGTCREAGLGLTIYRPSIVYGDSRTGRTLIFNAVYYPVRAAVFLKELYQKEIREKGGRRAAEAGVRLEADGTVHLPLRIPAARGRGLDLIPVDFFTEAFFALMEDAPEGGIFHIVSGRAVTIEDIVEKSSRFFRMTGIKACAPEDFGPEPRSPLELLYDRTIEAYRPYMTDTRIFETRKSGPILERRGLACPGFEGDVFARCMAFAVESGWGTRLFGLAGGKA